MLEAIERALAEVEAGDAKVLVVLGREGKFSAGFDLKVMTSGPEQARDLLGRGAELALRLYQATGERPYLDWALHMYRWTQTHLRDPADGLYWDHLAVDAERRSRVRAMPVKAAARPPVSSPPVGWAARAPRSPTAS